MVTTVTTSKTPARDSMQNSGLYWDFFRVFLSDRSAFQNLDQCSMHGQEYSLSIAESDMF